MKLWVWVLGIGGVLLLARSARASSGAGTGALLDAGQASWYGPGFDGKQTASGEIFDQNAMTAAHRTLKLGTVVDVTNLGNGKVVRVRVTDRGPFAKGRVLDLSKGAAGVLGYVEKGTANVEIRAV